MTEAITAASKSNTAKPMARTFGPSNYEEIAVKGVAQATDTYEKAKVTAEQATDVLKESYAAAAKGATEFNLKIMEIARTNTNTAFEYAQELMRMKSPSEFVTLSTEHARKQLDTIITQAKELTVLAQKVSSEITGPLQAGTTKAFNNKVA
jgi:phasin